MLIVGTDPVEVERLLRSEELVCPDCGSVLARWGHARERSSRGEDGTVRHVPRRARCTTCGGTHVLLAQLWLLRRADAVSVIGAALEAKAAGAGHRPIAAALDRPASTVRGWLRRFVALAETVRVGLTRLLYALDPQASALVPRACVVADALEAIGRAAAAAVVRLSAVGPWEFAARASAGLLLAPAPGVG
ncbi:hypothetical protein [Georgenia yuyongxinii]